MRVTNKDVERVCGLINDALGTPQEPYGPNGSNPGCVYVAGAYGGTKLEQMCDGGGCRDFLNTGYATKQEVYSQAVSWLDGFQYRERN